MISLTNVSGGYSRSVPVVRDLTISIAKGEFFSLIGPNGSGKTTLIRLIMGALSIHEGTIQVEGRGIDRYTPKELAAKVAVMTQENEVGMDFTVGEIVGLGRYPYQKGLLFREHHSDDEAIIKKAMLQTNTWQFRHSSYGTLSGGQKQRVLLAKALAQEPDILLLDEPTNHLDIRHSMELLDLLKGLQSSQELTIVAILHDLNLASLYSDRIGVMDKGTLAGVYEGLSAKSEAAFSDIYGVDMLFRAHPAVAKKAVFFEPAYLKGKESSLLAGLHAEKDSGSFSLFSAQPLRTLSIGKWGKGFTWEDRWRFIDRETEDSRFPEYMQLAADLFVAVCYDAATGQCRLTSMDECPLSGTDAFLLFAQRPEGYQLGVFVSAFMDEAGMMNLANSLSVDMVRLDGTSEKDVLQVFISIQGNSDHQQDWQNVHSGCKRMLEYAFSNKQDA
ncbi:ABC transporter ATP-binding protein [Bacillus testis]|uniref:ABC transporter ATP-binding protein n=1 Tax=Bacillus testis TaxID=1622072 RepID=UPI00067E88A2|nr:ABC transporter ATP-binding protein [Bacillus testis]